MAVVVNTGKHVLSVDSSATFILFALVAVVALVALVAVAALPVISLLITPGNLLSDIVPVEILDAFKDVNAEPFPPKDVAVNVPFEELKVKLLPVFTDKSPLACVTNNGKHEVSLLSSETLTLLADPVKSPTKELAVIIPVVLILASVLIVSAEIPVRFEPSP